MTPTMPPCTSTGLIDLCGVGNFLTAGSNDWFTIQVSNVVWLVILVFLVAVAIALPFPTRPVDYAGYEEPGVRDPFAPDGGAPAAGEA
jgi:hypothetical protein